MCYDIDDRIWGLMVIVSIIALLLGRFACRKRDEAGGTPLTASLVVLADIQICDALDPGSSDIDTKFFWIRLSGVRHWSDDSLDLCGSGVFRS